jgi:tRNA A-37 threonylcarbamoyl transferase component Bud32
MIKTVKSLYPRILSRGNNNAVIALSDDEVAKLFGLENRQEIKEEAQKLRFANTINELVVKFIRLDFDAMTHTNQLVMERLYPMDYRSYEIERRELWFEVFEDELRQLHQAGFVHRDICRPSNVGGLRYDNIFLTSKGLRLIDVAISALRNEVDEKLFRLYVQNEWKEVEEFKQYFLRR